METTQQFFTPRTDNVYFITGVSSGLGRALAEVILAQGGRVAGTVRRPEHVADLEALAPDGRALGVVLDVTDTAAVNAGVAQAIAHFGRIDVLISNAGYGLVGAVEETSDAEALKLFDVNVLGAHRVIRAALPHMRAQGSGHIMLAAAIGGFTGFGGLSVYTASKAAVDVLGEALAQEVKPFGIDVTVLTLGVFKTDFAGRSLNRVAEQVEAYEATPVGRFRAMMDNLDGNQPNDPYRAAEAIMHIAEAEEPPLRLALGNDALGVIAKKIDAVQADVEAWRELSASVAYAAA
ncbi:MAG: oxidoreductase [Bacteroidota bacterium]